VKWFELAQDSVKFRPSVVTLSSLQAPYEQLNNHWCLCQDPGLSYAALLALCKIIWVTQPA